MAVSYTHLVYAEAIKCNDSEEQMKLCEKLADEKASQLKHHSLFVSCTFIVCILAVLFFTRTVSFRQCLAGIYSHTGNYEKTWQNYEIVYMTVSYTHLDVYKRQLQRIRICIQNISLQLLLFLHQKKL